MLAKEIIRIDLFFSPYNYISVNIDINKIHFQKSVFPIFWRKQKKFHCSCITLCSTHTKLLEELHFVDSMFHLVMFDLELQPGFLGGFVSTAIKYWGSPKAKAIHSQLQPPLPVKAVSKAQINNPKITTLFVHWCWPQLAYSLSTQIEQVSYFSTKQP